MVEQIIKEEYSIHEIDTSQNGLVKLSALLSETFNNSTLTKEYLDWMYNQNPNGKVVGYNAIFKEKIVAHYALIPIEAEYQNTNFKALHSVNTATSFQHKGKGLFTKLAKMTYDKGLSLGYEFVLGVANTNSLYGFTEKLGWKYISQLDTSISLTYPKKINPLNLKNCLTLTLSDKAKTWKLMNPKFKYNEYTINGIKIIANELNFFSRSLVSLSQSSSEESKFLIPKLNFWVGISQSYSWNERPLMSIKIPDFLKPSPLHLIFKNLSSSIKLNKKNIHFEAINFDAF